jgi:hypothetical protein
MRSVAAALITTTALSLAAGCARPSVECRATSQDRNVPSRAEHLADRG